jgi:ketosteroid isomerase-like protein
MGRRQAFAAILLTVSLLAGCTLWREHPARKFADATGGEQLERVFWQQVKDQQWADLERHLAANLVAVMPTGSLDKTRMLEQLKQTRLERYSLGEFQVEWSGDTMVVAYTMNAQGTGGGAPLSSDPVHLVNVWQKINHDWVLIAHSVVPAVGR